MAKKKVIKNKTTEYSALNEKSAEKSNLEKLGDEELIKILFKYIFTPKEQERALEILKEIPDVSKLLNPNALLVALGGISRRADSFIKAMRAIYNVTDKVKVRKFSHEEQIEQLLIGELGNAVEEKFCVIFLSESGVVLRILNFSTNEKSRVAVEVNKIINSAENFSASNIIVAHNHPSGSLVLSQRDYLFMLELEERLGLFGITVKAHYLVSATGCKKVSLDNEQNL